MWLKIYVTASSKFRTRELVLIPRAWSNSLGKGVNCSGGRNGGGMFHNFYHPCSCSWHHTDGRPQKSLRDALRMFWWCFRDIPTTSPEHPQDIPNLKTPSKQPLILVMTVIENLGNKFGKWPETRKRGRQLFDGMQWNIFVYVWCTWVLFATFKK